MKSLSLKIRLPAVLLLLTAVLVGTNEKAFGQLETTSVMIQSTPAQGGIVSPEVGVHNMQFSTELVLTATPRSGYSFVYWIGDVSDPTSSRTTAKLNSPKIIIAVFEKNDYENLQPAEMVTKNPGGGVVPSPTYTPASGSNAMVVPDKPDKPTPPENNTDVPVPEPIPEPATGLIIITGSWFAIRKEWKVKRTK